MNATNRVWTSVLFVSAVLLIGPVYGAEVKKQQVNRPMVRDKNGGFADVPVKNVDKLLEVVRKRKDVDKLLEWAVFFEDAGKFDFALRFADEAQAVTSRSESIKFLQERIKAKRLKSSGRVKEAKELIERTINAPESVIFTDFSEGQTDGPFSKKPLQENIRMAKVKEKKLQKLPIKALLWQSAGKTSSGFLSDAQVYEHKKPPQLDRAFVMAREAYLLHGTRSGSIQSVYGRIALAYSKQLYKESRRAEADSILREYLSTPCDHLRRQAQEVFEWHGMFRPYKGDFGPYPDDFDYSR